jgi:hypothetical protein
MRDEGRRCEDSTVELAAASESLSGRGFVGLRRFARTFFQERRSPPNFATAVAPPLAGDPPGRHEPRDRLHGRPRVAHKLRKRPPVAVRDQFYPCIAARSIWSPAVSVPRHETSIAASADAVTSPQKTAPARKPSGGSMSRRCRPLLSSICLQLHGHTGGGEGLEFRNWHAWRCRHYRRAVLHAHVRHKHRRAGRRRARRWQVAAGLQAAVPSSAALRCSRRPSPPPSAPGNRSRARRLSSPGHGGSGSSSRWQCLLASVCRRARFAARVPTLLSTSMRSPDWVHRPLVASGAALLRGRSRSP